MFESSVRVPCVMHDPRRQDGGRRIDDLTSLFDLGPTIDQDGAVADDADAEGETMDTEAMPEGG